MLVTCELHRLDSVQQQVSFECDTKTFGEYTQHIAVRLVDKDRLRLAVGMEQTDGVAPCKNRSRDIGLRFGKGDQFGVYARVRLGIADHHRCTTAHHLGLK